jgi:hypothetical protein
MPPGIIARQRTDGKPVARPASGGFSRARPRAPLSFSFSAVVSGIKAGTILIREPAHNDYKKLIGY